MAIFGNLKVIEKQLNNSQYKVAISYLNRVFHSGSMENLRLLSLESNAFKKVVLDEDSFALEQVYYTKHRSDCFFESHKNYIDVQFILSGEEIIEVANINCLKIKSENDDMDLVKYCDTNHSSIIKLKKGDVAIFFPDDAHMPCIQLTKSNKLHKTVVKVKV